jgi:hypothetical protein
MIVHRVLIIKITSHRLRKRFTAANEFVRLANSPISSSKSKSWRHSFQLSQEIVDIVVDARNGLSSDARLLIKPRRNRRQNLINSVHRHNDSKKNDADHTESVFLLKTSSPMLIRSYLLIDQQTKHLINNKSIAVNLPWIPEKRNPSGKIFSSCANICVASMNNDDT